MVIDIDDWYIILGIFNVDSLNNIMYKPHNPNTCCLYIANAFTNRHRFGCITEM